LDPKALFVIAAREYFTHSHDMDFCVHFEPAMDRAIHWLLSHDRDGDGLIENRYLAGWTDSILKKDKVFYLNVAFYEGLRASELSKSGLGTWMTLTGSKTRRIGPARPSSACFGMATISPTGSAAHAVEDSLPMATFWPCCSATSEVQARAILRFIASRGLDRDSPLRTCDPVYPLSQVFPFYVLAGIPDYHRTLLWPWLGTLNAINKFRLGEQSAALGDLARIGAWFVERNTVAEVYEPDGKLLQRRFYRAEVPFAWNAGLYVYAVRAVGLAAKFFPWVIAEWSDGRCTDEGGVTDPDRPFGCRSRRHGPPGNVARVGQAARVSA
jgi:hypothetical protein